MRSVSARRIGWTAGLAVFSALAVLVAQDDVIFVTREEVRVPVTVKDGKRFVNGLTQRDFRLFDNKHPQNFKLDEAVEPISLVVAIQGDQHVDHFLPKIKQMGPLLENLILGEAGEAALLVFDHRQRWIQEEFTNDGKVFNKALASVKAGSTTSGIIDAVSAATIKLRSRPNNHRKVILLIAETRDKGSQGNLREILEEAEQRNIAIYSVNMNRFISALTDKGQPPRPDPYAPGQRPRIPGAAPNSTGNVSGMGASLNSGDLMPLIIEGFKQAKSLIFQNTAEAMTQYTGGREYGFTDTRDLEKAITDIGEELHSEYMLTYAPSNEAKAEGGWHELRVMVADKSGKASDIRNRPGYWAAAQRVAPAR